MRLNNSCMNGLEAYVRIIYVPLLKCNKEFGFLMIFCISFLTDRAAIEYEKKGYAENYEHGQVMEKKLISMARELEKLRAEIANAEKIRAAGGSGGNPGMQAIY